jgi:hypothetical protein
MGRGRRSTAVLLAALTASLALLVLAACGEEEKEGIVEGEPVELGALEWNVLFSRFLNPNDVEDREYLVGMPEPPADAAYLGIFVELANEDEDEAQPIPETLEVEDTDGNVYDSIPSESLYALRLGTDVGPEEELPTLDSTAQAGPIKGSMILFLIPDAATENRPLELVIPGQDGPATVELDI